LRNATDKTGIKKRRKRGLFSKDCRIFALFDFVQEMGLEPFDSNSNVPFSRPFCGYVGKSVGNFFCLFYFITNEKAFPPQECLFYLSEDLKQVSRGLCHKNAK